MQSRSYPSEHRPEVPSIRMFGWGLRIGWIALFCLLLISELVPRPLSFAPLIYYSYSSAKAAMFILLGLATPLSFWRFDSLGFGAFFSAVAAGAAELSQSGLEGHHSSFAEFALKLLLLFVGFACALNARYDRKLGLGRFYIQLWDLHQSKPR